MCAIIGPGRLPDYAELYPRVAHPHVNIFNTYQYLLYATELEQAAPNFPSCSTLSKVRPIVHQLDYPQVLYSPKLTPHSKGRPVLHPYIYTLLKFYT